MIGVPVVFRAPLMRFHVPPLVILPPAIIARFGKFMARMFRLLAVVAVMLDGFVQVVVGFFGAVLALSLARLYSWRPCKQQKAA